MKDFITLADLTAPDLNDLLERALEIKTHPARFTDALNQKILLMIFEKPSLRTRLSFEAAILRMGGNAILYDTHSSPMNSGKETIEDTVKTASRYVDGIMARLYKHSDLEKFSEASEVPVINGLTNFSHPCQILADLLTIKEKKNKLEGLTLCYCGDGNNNVTHSLLFGCALAAMNIRIACPAESQFQPSSDVLARAEKLNRNSKVCIEVTNDARAAAQNADVVYTDSWMSYHIDQEKLEERIQLLKPFQVNTELLEHAEPGVIFMNCLPALRGYEQTAEVIDGPASVVFDQAENRLYAQSAILKKLLATQ